MISIRNLTIGFGKRTLLKNVDTDIKGGTLTALIGRNGSGKSTLLRAIAGLNGEFSGEISICGRQISDMPPRIMAKSLALVTTGRTRIPDLRCRDVAALGRAPYTDWIGRLRSKDIEIVDNALKSVGMYEYADRTMDKMSDGECQRIMIARAIAQSTPVILLDEPTSFLDMPNRYELCSLLRSLAHNDGKCILFSTHELDIAMQMCDNIILLDNPTLYNLPPAQLAASGHIERLFRNNTVSIDGRTGKRNRHGI